MSTFKLRPQASSHEIQHLVPPSRTAVLADPLALIHWPAGPGYSFLDALCHPHSAQPEHAEADRVQER